MKKNSQKKPLDSAYVCGHGDPLAVRELLTRIGDKWSIFVVLTLARVHDNRARFSGLDKTVPGISQRMLTLTLRNLERDGLVSREVFPEIPPRVEYELTTLGKSLLQPLDGLVDWVTDNWQDVKKAQAGFDSR